MKINRKWPHLQYHLRPLTVMISLSLCRICRNWPHLQYHPHPPEMIISSSLRGQVCTDTFCILIFTSTGSDDLSITTPYIWILTTFVKDFERPLRVIISPLLLRTRQHCFLACNVCNTLTDRDCCIPITQDQPALPTCAILCKCSMQRQFHSPSREEARKKQRQPLNVITVIGT